MIKGQVAAGRWRFSMERAIFLTVLHRLFDPGSDRAAERWKEDFQITRDGGHRAASPLPRDGVAGRAEYPAWS